MENRSHLYQPHLRRIISQYQLSDLLGSGSYSQVFKARHLQNANLFAIKVVSNKILAENAKVKECINNQLAIHNQLEPCPYIVRFHELLQTRNNCYFVYEYCQGGTLLQLIKREKTINEKRALEIFSQLIKGLKVLRKYNIMHRDLKPENVLIKQGNFKLADFGFCKELGGENMTKTMLGSPLYMAPEVLRGEAYSVNADVWSVGVILYQMLYGHCPFESNSIASLITTIDDTCLIFDPSISISAAVRRFIIRCLQKDCRKRATWDQLFDEVNRLLENKEVQNHNNTSQINNKNSRRTIMKANTMCFEDHSDRSPTLKKHNNSAFSKSKYQIFKDNYSKVNNEASLFSNTLEPSKNDRSRTIQVKKSDFHDKEKQAKISYNKVLAQHEACLKVLRYILQSLQLKDKNVYWQVGLMLKGVRNVLEKIYSRINLDDSEMLPVLSVVKYQLIQIDKMAAQVQRVLPTQTDGECEKARMPFNLVKEWNHFLQTCYN